MQAVECVARLLGDGHLHIPAAARRELRLRPEEQVRVILLRDETPQLDARQSSAADERSDVWRRVDALRQRFAGMDFSLTDSLLEARGEEDATL